MHRNRAICTSDASATPSLAMNLAFRNPALLQWQALMPGAALRGVREVVFHTGMRWPGAATEPPQVWFVESGLLALEQRSAGGFVDVAWIGGEGAVPLLEHGALGLRALCDGRALCLPVAQALSQVPALLLGWQQDLRARMARLAACARASARAGPGRCPAVGPPRQRGCRSALVERGLVRRPALARGSAGFLVGAMGGGRRAAAQGSGAAGA